MDDIVSGMKWLGGPATVDVHQGTTVRIVVTRLDRRYSMVKQRLRLRTLHAGLSSVRQRYMIHAPQPKPRDVGPIAMGGG